MTENEYRALQEQITKLYESTKYKGYSAKERAGAEKFCLAVKSMLKSNFKYQWNEER